MAILLKGQRLSVIHAAIACLIATWFFIGYFLWVGPGVVVIHDKPDIGAEKTAPNPQTDLVNGPYRQRDVTRLTAIFKDLDSVLEADVATLTKAVPGRDWENNLRRQGAAKYAQSLNGLSAQTEKIQTDINKILQNNNDDRRDIVAPVIVGNDVIGPLVTELKNMADDVLATRGLSDDQQSRILVKDVQRIDTAMMALKQWERIAHDNIQIKLHKLSEYKP